MELYNAMERLKLTKESMKTPSNSRGDDPPKPLRNPSRNPLEVGDESGKVSSKSISNLF